VGWGCVWVGLCVGGVGGWVGVCVGGGWGGGGGVGGDDTTKC